MPLVDPTAFDGRAVDVVYIAARLPEAKRVEALLTGHGVDFAVDSEPLWRRVLGIFPVEYEGVGFYVAAEQIDTCRRLLREAGLVVGLVEDEPD